MELSDLATLLPPGLLGLGGIIPIVIGNNPFSDDAKAKPLLATVAVLMVWLVWICCLMLFRIFLFSQYWAMLWILTAIVCFGLLVRDILIPKKVPEPVTVEESEAMAVKAKKRVALFYSGGLLSTAVAASILVAMKGWVVIDVRLGSTPPHEFKEVSLRSYKTGVDHTLQHPTNRKLPWWNVIRVAVAEKDFDSEMDWDHLCLENPKPDKKGNKTTLYLARARMSHIIMPGAGVFLEGTPTNNRTIYTNNSNIGSPKTVESRQ